MSKKVFELEFYGKKLVEEIGDISKHADDSFLIRLDDKAEFCSICGAKRSQTWSRLLPINSKLF